MEGRMKHVGGQVELDGKRLPISNSRAMAGHRLRRRLAHPSVRHERPQPDPEGRPDGE